ncbi:DUF2637 domain-containing protein [Streptosporangium canum]|uniref:DUF2637 domain-containing protein n=1 Tax=Streptosporangium canum TaxID=324952 RepID=UPI0036B1D52B
MIRFTTTAVVLLLAAVAAVVSYRHILEVVQKHGETGWVAYLVPLCIDGLLVAASLILLDAAKRGLGRHWLSWVALGTGIVLTLGANVLHGIQFGPIGAITSALPSITLTISFELLMGMIRRSAGTAISVPLKTDMPDEEFEKVWREVEEILQAADPVEVRVPVVPPQVTGPETPADLREFPKAPVVEVQPETVPESDPLYPLALSNFLGDVTVGEVPSVRTIKSQMSVGTDRARKLQAYLGQLVTATS